MVAPGGGFRGGTFFRTKNIGEDQKQKTKKGFRCKMSGFAVQKYVKTKIKVFAQKSVSF